MSARRREGATETMPNRIIKESICTSDKINRLTDFEFRLWVSLLTYVDDYGRGDARPAIIKGRCFPLRDRITATDIQKALCTMADIGVVRIYEVDRQPLLCLPGWEKHQRIQQKRSKYPAPDDGDLPQKEQKNGEMVKSTVTHRDPPPESNPNPNPKPNPNPNPNRPTADQGESEETDRGFDAFWAAYPVHKAKARAYQVYAEISPDTRLLEVILLAIQRQKKWRHWRSGYIPTPANWLRERRWEDEEEPELLEARPTRQGSAADYSQREYDEEELERRLAVDD